nr:uncharacterized protein LOC129164711 [Nothobranchius furzeri]
MDRKPAKKSVKQLKAERTSAKRSFTRLANNITRQLQDMSEKELEENFNKISLEAEKVMTANDEVGAGLLAETEDGLDEDEPELTSDQQADLDEATKDCEERLKQVKTSIQETLWRMYGKAELGTEIQVAEDQSTYATTIKPEAGKAANDFILSHLQMLLKSAKEAYSRWRRWIPRDVQEELQIRLRDLDLILPKLVSRTAEFIQMESKDDEGKDGQMMNFPNQPLLIIRLKPTSLPKFTGNKRDFCRWRKDWEALQKQGEPTGSKEVKKAQLLDSISEKLSKDLRLNSYNTSDDIFRVLENRFGNRTAIIIEIVEELQRIPTVRGHQPRRIVELIQAVEKALEDLSDLGDTGAIKNPLVTKSIETKLVESLKKEWLVYAADKKNSVASANPFDNLLAFLKKQEDIYEQLEQLEQLKEEEPSRKGVRSEPRLARTKSAASEGDSVGCVVCGDPKHKRRLYFRKKFQTLTLAQKKDALRKTGACMKCMEVHDKRQYCKPTYLCRNQSCKGEENPDHHYYLCPHAERSNSTQRKNRFVAEESDSMRKYAEDQEEFLRRLSPELAEHCKNVFTNAVTKTCGIQKAKKDQSNLLMGSGLEEAPVLMMILEVTANDGQRIGMLIDLASDTNYITHKAARKLNLCSEEIALVVHGVGGMKIHVKTRCYLLKIRVMTQRGVIKSHQLVCYGLDDIATIHKHVTAEQLQQIFPDVSLEELNRPNEINLLISHREGKLAPQRKRVVGDLVLWDGPLGKAVGGTHPELFEGITMTACYGMDILLLFKKCYCHLVVTKQNVPFFCRGSGLQEVVCSFSC